jgi:RNA polymerase sigma-70 factor (ECF subfamily)
MVEAKDARFPTTSWTLIARLKGGDAEDARRALDELCTQYHYPLYCYIRRSGLDHHDAEDALHDFFAKLLRLEVFAEAEPEQGRLRALLGTALRRFLANWHRDRPHRNQEVSADATVGDEQRYRAERFIEAETPERIFERKWGHELLARVLVRLGESYAKRGRSAVFEELRPALAAGGTLRGGDAPEIAARLGMSEGALRAALARLLTEYREVLEAEVRQTVERPEDVEDEIAHLLSLFQRE